LPRGGVDRRDNPWIESEDGHDEWGSETQSAIAGPTANAISAVEFIRIGSMFLPLRKIDLPELENIAIMGGDE
jgi:hypothetical protein